MSVLDLFFSNAGYNTRVVTTGVTLLGIAAGVVGTFTFLRRRSLLSDALSHATLPGICLAFLAAVAVGAPARSLPVLLFGAAVSGAIGLLCVQWISHRTRLNEDAAIAIVLSSFFGLGVVLLTYVQVVESGSQAGLDSFIMGQTAAMSAAEAWSIGLLALIAVVITWFFYKELQLYSFDADFAQGLGWSVARLDLLVAGLTVFVTVIGLQAVGLILIVALLIVPPVAARFWTEKLPVMLLLSGAFGGLSAFSGARLSAVYPDLPTGAVIVICAGVLFMASLLFAPQRGIVASVVRRLTIAIELQSSRFLAELLLAENEQRSVRSPELPSWQLRWIERRLAVRGWLVNGRLTPAGRAGAQAVNDNLRLWEAYLWVSQESFPDKYQWGIDDINLALSEETIALLQKTIDNSSTAVVIHRD
ncbi:MAG: metal ABC transporter permease [Gammaproteobacteria bacterium]|nr:metal ABC transporter permease [Gammaproteobacteria bacterium]